MGWELAYQTLGLPKAGPSVRFCHTPSTDDPIQEGHDEPIDISHELRTILAIITLVSGNLDLFYERLDEEKRRKMIRDIRTQTRKLNTLVCDVLDYCGEMS